MNTKFLQIHAAEHPVLTKESCLPPPPKYNRAKLATLKDVRRELGKLYRDARNGRIDVADASRMANMLSILSRILIDSELEARVEKLENQG